MSPARIMAKRKRSEHYVNNKVLLSSSQAAIRAKTSSPDINFNDA